MVMPALHRGWTAADVRLLIEESPPGPRYELVRGELLVTPAPSAAHQLAAGAILRVLDDYLDANPVGWACHSPADLELQPDNVLQPDVFVVRAGSRGPGADPAKWAGVTSLLLAVEVVSPSSARFDRVTKRDFYLEADVAEYWVIDVTARAVERWTREATRPRIEHGQLEWQPAGATVPLKVDLPALFSRIDKKIRL
jgi:Uma2 family endonuclease